jgi:ribokinase
VANVARLTVLGSLNMDIAVTVPVLPGPGATVLGGAALFAPGGKGANQAVAAARLGGAAGMTVAMVGCVGDDEFGRTLRKALRTEGIDDEGVRVVDGVPTGIAMITVDEAGENMITVAPGANRETGPAELERLAGPAATAPQPDAPSVLVISAEVPAAAIRAALTASTPPRHTAPNSPNSPNSPNGPNSPDSLQVPTAPSAPPAPRRLTVLNLAPAPPAPEAAALLAARPDWLVVNESEAAAILGRPVSGLTEAASAAADLVLAGARNAVVTAGAAGSAYHAGATEQNQTGGTVAAFPVQALDTVGAGDTFVGALAVALAAGIGTAEAVTAATAAAAAAVTRQGTQTGMPHPAEVHAATGYRWPVAGGRRQVRPEGVTRQNPFNYPLR